MTTLSDVESNALTAATKPYSVRNDKMTIRQHKLKDIVALHEYLSSIDAVSSSATQVDSDTAVVPGVRTNQLKPGGAV